MHSIASLVKSLRRDFPELLFAEGEDFSWSFETQTISYHKNSQSTGVQQLLHELAHALLEHKTYKRDIELVAMERDAWAYARTQLSNTYEIPIADAVEQAALDSYRDWMHARSTCPACEASGIEIRKSIYHCPACGHEWRVNEARICGLKRYDIQK